VRAVRLFHGWIVVAGAFGVMFVCFGSAYSFAAFFEPLQLEFAASRGALSLVFSLAAFLYFVLGAPSGMLADRLGSRRVCAAGIAVIGLGLVGAGLARSLPGIYLAYSLGIGVGVGLAYVPSVGAVQRWFRRRRGTASGIAVAGIGVGTLVMPPVAALLIERLGWRGAYMALGALALVLGGLAVALVDSAPERRGLGPDGDPPLAVAAAADGPLLREAARTRVFWQLFLSSSVGGIGLFVPFVHLVPYAQGEGVPRAAAVALIGLVGIGSTVGRFFLGGLADRLGRRRSVAAMWLGMAATLLFWPFAHGAASLGAFALLFGLFYGGFVALMPALIADYFGTRHLGGIIGVQYAAVGFGTLAGPTFAGVAYDLTESYTLPILAAAATAGIACLAVVAAPEPRPS
jgi:MFS family permease